MIPWISQLKISLPLGSESGFFGQIGLWETVARTVTFLVLLALLGYLLVAFNRHRCLHRGTPSTGSNPDAIRIVAMRSLGGRKCLAAVEHRGRRFLLALHGDRVEKISEWEIGGDG